MASMSATAFAMAFAIAGPFGATTAANADGWTRTMAPNGAFSIETPCTAGEITALRSVSNAALPISNYVPESRVVCKKGGWVFMAGVVNATDLPAGVSAYDYIAQKVADAANVQGRPTETMIGGRRALVNRGGRSGIVGQTGFVEISPTKIITLVAGAKAADKGGAEMEPAIDRFYASIEVKGR